MWSTVGVGLISIHSVFVDNVSVARSEGAGCPSSCSQRRAPAPLARCTLHRCALAAPGPAHVHSLPRLSLISATWTDLLHCLRRRPSPAHTSKLRMSCTRLYPITYTTALFIYLASSTRDVARTSQFQINYQNETTDDVHTYYVR